MLDINTFISTANTSLVALGLSAEGSGYLTNLILTIAFSLLVAFVFTRYGASLNNRSSLAKNFVILGVTTMMIITVVQSSLELSLGLVGALSIVRFRTAIKDPEELTYLFLIIGVGVGVGANRANISLISLMVILPMVALLFKANRGVKPNDGLYISVISHDDTDQDQEKIFGLIRKHVSRYKVTRVESTPSGFEILILADSISEGSLAQLTQDIRQHSVNVQVSAFATSI